MAPLESLGISRTQVISASSGSREIGRPKQSRRTSPLHESTRKPSIFKRHDDEQAQLHISIFLLQEFDQRWRRLRDSRNSVPPRNWRERHHWRERLEATEWPNLTLSKSSLPQKTSSSARALIQRGSRPCCSCERIGGHIDKISRLRRPEKSHGPSGLPVPIQRDVYVSKSIGALCECDQNVPRWGEPATARR